MAVREILAANGVPDDRFAAVTGKADTDRCFPDNPYLAANRRVEILLLEEAPPLPFGRSSEAAGRSGWRLAVQPAGRRR